MSEQTPDLSPKTNEDEAFIPPYYMLILAVVGLVVALAVWITQPTFTVVGWGGLGITVLSLVAWVLMAPQQAKAFITGRTARFGGTSILVTLIVLVALIAIYTFIRGQDIRIDLTQRNEFSLARR
jgi:cellobiose-specific phosphotransferase system component IIC